MDIPVGARIGPYEILSQIGAGGMGEVYKARDSRLGRIVAIKRIRPELLGERARARFDREARVIAALNHPNICTLYDLVEHDGDALLVMEYLEGETLAERLLRGSLPVAELLRYASEVADALDRAHRRGIIHRDLKPSNIILTQSGAKLVDFGVARRAVIDSSDGTDVQGLTAEGAVVGTLAYMAPEQLRGFEVDARTDLFAFGAILYEGLTRAHAVTTGPARAPSASDLRPDAPAALVQLIDRCLAEKPDDRWQSAHDVKLRLRQIEQTVTVDVAPTHPPRPRRRLRAILAAASLLVITAVAGAVYVARQSAPPIHSLAILPLHNATGNADAEYLGDGISDSIITNLSQLAGLHVVPRSLSSRFKGRSADPREVSKNLKARAILTGDVAERGDTLAITVELFDAGENTRLWGKQYVRKFTDIFEVQEEIARDISENLRLKLTPAEKSKLRRRYTEDSEAYRLYLQGSYVLSRFPQSDPKMAISFFEQAIQKDPTYAPAYAGLARCYIAMGYWGRIPQKEAQEKGGFYVRRALALDDSLAEAHAAAGWLPGLTRKQREQEFLRALALDPQSADAHLLYAVFLETDGRVPEAERHLRAAISLGATTPVSTWVQLYERDCPRVFIEAQKVLASDPEEGFTHRVLARCLERTGRTAEAVEHYLHLYSENPQAAKRLLDAFNRGGMKAFWKTNHDLFDEAVARGEPVAALNRARIELTVGNREKAIEWLTKSVDANETAVIWINTDPDFDPLRGDPRFEALRRRLGYGDP